METKELSLVTDATTIPLFERLCSLEEREAFLEHKSIRGNKRDIDDMRAYVLSDECVDDLHALLEGKFDLPLPRQVMLRKSHSNRRRVLFVYPYRQNTLMKYILWGMHEYDDIFSDSLFSFRRRISSSSLFRRIIKADYARGFYTLKADVHDYGMSIRPEKLIPMLRDIVGQRDPALFAFFEYMLTRDEYYRDGKLVKGSMGGLPGVPIGCFFNNVYLMSLDEEMVAMSAMYSRYADDIAVFTETREQAEAALKRMLEIVDGLDISLNDDKTMIIEPGGDIELLGIEIRDGNLDVADSTLAKATNKLRHYADKLVRREHRRGLPRQVAAAMMARKIDRYFYTTDNTQHELSWQDFFFSTITRDDSLHVLDLLCQDLIRRVATGKRGDSRYRFRYDDIKALGYRSLVREYHRSREEREEERNNRVDSTTSRGHDVLKAG